MFVESCGAPVIVAGQQVVQLDNILVHKGTIRVSMTSQLNGKHGVCLKNDKGGILLSDESRTKRLHIWNNPELPSVVEHRIDCRDGQLKVWNIYRVTHPEGVIT